MGREIPQRRSNWAGAFTAYCTGAPLEEISQIFDIDLVTLKDNVSRQHWAQLRTTLPLDDTLRDDKAMATVTQIRIAAIQKNRDQNLAAWTTLRDHAVELIGQLRDKKLKMEKLFNMKSHVGREEVEPTTGDMVNIATYLRTISDGTYRALGDFAAQEKPGQDGAAGAGAAGVPSITIILPGVIAQPRDQRGEPTQAQIIDLRPEAAEGTTLGELKSAGTPELSGAPQDHSEASQGQEPGMG